MSVKTREELNGYTETGAQPTSDQFRDILDTTWLKSEPIPIQQLNAGSNVLAPAANVIWDYSVSANMVMTIDQDVTIDIQNLEEGNVGHLMVIQDATGGWSLTLPAGHKTAYNGGGSISLTDTPGAIDVIVVLRLNNAYVWLLSPNFT